MESLAKLKPAFKKGGTTTAGNSSQVSDGAAAVIFARRSVAKKLGMPILAKFVDYAVKGCDPLLMGIGPAVAIPAVLEKVGKKVNDVDIWEINEAFASQATYSVEKLGIDYKKLNPKGGAIALGHPLGCTGTFSSIQAPDKLLLCFLSLRGPVKNQEWSQCALELVWEPQPILKANNDVRSKIYSSYQLKSNSNQICIIIFL